MRRSIVVALLAGVWACTPDNSDKDSANGEDSGDSGDGGDSGDSDGDSGDSGDSGGDTSDSSDTGGDSGGDTSDSGDTGGDSGDTGGDTGTAPEATVYLTPDTIDFGTIWLDESVAEAFHLGSVGPDDAELSLTISGTFAGEWSVSPSALTLSPGETVDLDLSVTPSTWGDYSVTVTIDGPALSEPLVLSASLSVQEDADADRFASEESGGTDCDDSDPLAFPGNTETWYDGVDGDCSGGGDYDRDGDFISYPADCDDGDPTIYPDALDTWYDGIDTNCDGANDFDQDGDAWESPEDCDDTVAEIYPGATDTWYDGIDSDCAGNDDNDADGDGSDLFRDCDEANAAIHPAATEVWYDGVDNDCDGWSDFDQDLDGDEWTTDCDDTNAAVSSLRTETWYDGLDENCDGLNDFDQDGDGENVTTDCDDTDATSYAGAPDTWYDAVDSNCDGANDFDQDADGETVTTDCDDTDATSYAGAPDTWYDGIDNNCDGANDFDQDADGETVTTDCDDTDGTAYAGAPDAWYDGLDNNCDGADDFDQDADGDPIPSDCDDLDPSISTLETEIWYDGIDSDCDGANDNDQDGDGEEWSTDCDDEEPTTYTGAADAWYDGVDSNCDGANDYDQDADGVDFGTDCDDTDASLTISTDETIDGLDNDCDGSVDELDVTTATSGVLYGISGAWALGKSGSIGMGGDMNYDGYDDLVVASDELSTGHAWIITGSALTGAADKANVYDYADISGYDYDRPLRFVGSPFSDVDGDGTDDLVISGSDDSGYDGGTWVVRGGATMSGNFFAVPTTGAEISGDGDYDGIRWAEAGDIDGDGQSDVVVGATDDSRGGSYGSGGTLAVFLGGSSLSGDLDLDDADGVVGGTTAGDEFGHSLTVADTNNDGHDDILASSPYNNSTARDSGAIYLLLGNAGASWSTTADNSASFEIDGVGTEAELGRLPLPSPTDLDGDGDLDLIINSADESVWIYWTGSLSGTLTTASAGTTLTGSDSFGEVITAESDLDGDGALDLVIGAPDADDSYTNGGAVYVFGGSSSWPSTLSSSDADFSFEGSANGDYLGSGLASGADLDGDGNDDLAIGAEGQDGGGTTSGAVYFIRGW